MTTLRAAGATDVGRVREINEDRYVVDDDLFAVADGVGGHKAGEVASQTSVETLKSVFTEPDTAALVRAVREANDAVWELAQSHSDRHGMGTTLTAAALVQDTTTGEDRLAVVNVGDSRAYLLQHGELMQVTEDHSLVEEMVRDGRITSQEALVHPRRSIITRALGMEPAIEVDSWEIVPYTGDRLLLCTDGLTNELTEDRIAAILRQLADPAEAAGELVRQARGAGGNDNITAVVIDVVDDGGRAESASAALGREPRLAPPPKATSTSAPAPALAGLGASSAGSDDNGGSSRPRPQLVDAPVVARRRFTWRTGLFLVMVVGILAGAFASVGWYARSSWYVGLDTQERVTVFRGRPDGLLWFKPTVEDTRLNLTIEQVQPIYQAEVRSGKQFSSKMEADRYVNRVRSTTPPPTTTTTTAIPPTTATTGPPP